MEGPWKGFFCYLWTVCIAGCNRVSDLLLTNEVSVSVVVQRLLLRLSSHVISFYAAASVLSSFDIPILLISNYS